MAGAEGMDGQVDGACLGNMELVLQGADTLIILQEETTFHVTVLPLL